MSVSHLWLGLLSSIVVFIVCLTGSIYAFKSQIEDLYNYNVVYIEALEQAPLPLHKITKIFEEKQRNITQLILPNKLNKSIQVSFTSTNGKTKAGAYYVNPYTGVILGAKNFALDGFFEAILALHKNLMGNNIGRQIVAAATLIFVVLLFSGLILWWPKKLKNLKRNLTIKLKAKMFRVVYDLHNTLGFYALLLLLVMAITGLYVSYPWVKSSLIVALGGTPVLTDNASNEVKEELSNRFSQFLGDIIEKQEEKTAPSTSSISIDSIIQMANYHLPYHAITVVDFPNKENSRFTIKKFNRENWLGAIFPDHIELNKKGELKSTNLFKDKPLNKQFIALSLPLHTGEILGLPGVILYFITSLIGCSLPVTGFLIWWKKAFR